MRATERLDGAAVRPPARGARAQRRAPTAPGPRLAQRRHDAAEAATDIGTLRDDPDALAARVARASACATVTVWVDDECRVHGSAIDALPAVPLHWIVGTYACGAALADIADDLRHARSERERAWCID